MLRFLSHRQCSTHGRGTNAACAICLWRVTFFSPLSLYNCFCASLFSLFSFPCFPIHMQPLRREVIEGSDLFGSGFLYIPKAYEHFYCNVFLPHLIHEIWLISTCECYDALPEWIQTSNMYRLEKITEKTTCNICICLYSLTQHHEKHT